MKKDRALLSSGEEVDFDLLVWAAGPEAHDYPKDFGVALGPFLSIVIRF